MKTSTQTPIQPQALSHAHTIRIAVAEKAMQSTGVAVSLDVDPVTGIDPVLYQGPVSPSKTRFQRKPPLVDRHREYEATRSHQATNAMVTKLSERHQVLQIEQEEQFHREYHTNQYTTHYIENQLATTGIPTLNTVDVLIQRERKGVQREESRISNGMHRATMTKKQIYQQQFALTTLRVQQSIRNAYGSHILDLKALELVHLPPILYSTLLLQLGRFITTVNLSRNALRDIPCAFLNAFPQVTHLNYKENALDRLPDTERLTSLKEWNVEGNQVRTLPLHFPLTLQSLILNRNRLSHFFYLHELTKLIELELGYNHFQSLPPGLTCLVSLKKFVMTGNQLITLALLPMYRPSKQEEEKKENIPIETEQKQWRVEMDHDTKQPVYYNTITHIVTRIPPPCFRPPKVPPLALGTTDQKQKQHYQDCVTQYPDGWEIRVNGRPINQCTTIASTRPLTASNEPSPLVYIHHQLSESPIFTTLPSELDTWGALHRLQFLCLSNNQIMELPSSIGQLVSLRRFEIENNQLVKIPDIFENLHLLQVVRLGMNRLSDLPCSFFQLDHLIELDLKLNQFQVLPDLFHTLWRLENLDLSSNKLEILPTTWLQLKHLTTLRLQNNPKLVTSGLYHADTIASGKIEQVFWEIKHGIQCQEYHGKAPQPHGQIIGIGQEVWSTDLHLKKEWIQVIEKAKETHQLDFHWKNCTISQIPSQFYTLTQLQVLRLSGHAFLNLPNSFNVFNSLRILQLRKNHIVEIQDEIFSNDSILEHLDLEYNQLETLPISIGKLKSLQILRLTNNQIKKLPLSMGELHVLQELFLSHNQLEIPSIIFNTLYQLQHLDLSHNHLATLDPIDFTLLTHLKILRLQCNHISYLPTSLQTCPLEELSLGGNSFTIFPSIIPHFQATLKILKMQSNKISTLPYEFGHLSHLEKIELEGNPFRSPPPEIMRLGIISIRSYLSKRQERVEEITHLLTSMGIPFLPQAFETPQLDQLIPRTAIDHVSSLAFLTLKHIVMFEHAIDQYVNGSFYLNPIATLRGADLLNQMILQKQFYIAQQHREEILRDLLKLCQLIRSKRWLDKVDFRYDLQRPWGRNGELCSVYMLNPRALYDDQDQLPSIYSVLEKRVAHGFKEEGFYHSESSVVDAITHYIGIYGLFGCVHNEVPFQCACESLLRFNKHHQPCYRPGWTFIQILYTEEESKRREKDEQEIAHGIETLRPQIQHYLQTMEGEKRFHLEIRKIKDKLRTDLQLQKKKIQQIEKKYQQGKKQIKKQKQKDLKHKRILTVREMTERKEEEERVLKLSERLIQWKKEYEDGKKQLRHGYEAFMNDVVTVLLKTVGIEIQTQILRQQRQHAIEFGLRRPWDGQDGCEFERYKQLVVGQRIEEEKDDNSEISDVSYEGYQDLVSNLKTSQEEEVEDKEERIQAYEQLEVSDVSDTESIHKPINSEESDL